MKHSDICDPKIHLFYAAFCLYWQSAERKRNSIMNRNHILTIGTVAAGIAVAGLVGAACCCLASECGKGHQNHVICGLSPMREMKRMAGKIKKMMSDAI